MDVVNDALKAECFIEEDYDTIGSIPSKLRRGFFSTNESLSYIKDMGVEDKRVLTVCGSGDHAFMSLIYGASEVDTFDCNPFQYYIMELKKAAIMGLDKEDYLKFFPLKGGNINEMYNGKYYEMIKEYLDGEARKFWDYIYSKKNYKIYLLELFSYPISFDSDYTRYYDLLKESLFKKRINFKLEDVCHISESLNNDTYKLIMLSNVYDHIYKNKEYNEDEYLEMVKNNFCPLLETGGTCVYHYQLPCIDHKSFKAYPSIKNGGDEIKVMTK